MNKESMHRAQFEILRNLRHHPQLSYSQLMKPTELESDVFKFLVRKLAALRYIEKDSNGAYQLTSSGKELANNLDKEQRAVQRQPKLSLALCVTKYENGTPYCLVQERRRSPFYGFVGLITGPAKWGKSFEEVASHELEKQTGLQLNLQVSSFYRQLDSAYETDEVLEDKLFIVLRAECSNQNFTNSWDSGVNYWISESELDETQNIFDSTRQMIALKPTEFYNTNNTSYNEELY